MQNPLDHTLLKRPKIIHSATFRHLIILCLDGGGSMQALAPEKITKADSVSSAIRDLFSIMKSSWIGVNYSFAIVNYDHRAKVIMPPTATKDIDDKDNRQYDPTLGFGGAQFISEGLMKAQELAEQFLAQSTPGGLSYSVTILIISDGGDMNHSKTVELAQQLKEKNGIQIAGCLVETLGADQEELQSRSEYVKGLCSEEWLFSCVLNSEYLRYLFIMDSEPNVGIL